MDFIDNFFNRFTSTSDILADIFYKVIIGLIVVLLYKYVPKFLRFSYNLINKTSKNKYDNKKKLHDELLVKINNNDDDKVAFYFFENRIRSKFSLAVVVFLISFLAVFIFLIPMLNDGFRTSFNPGDRFFIISIILTSYGLLITSAMFALHYLLLLIQIKSILHKIAINPRDYMPM